MLCIPSSFPSPWTTDDQTARSAHFTTVALLDDCNEPTPPPPGATLEQQLAYLRALSDYTRCLLEKGQGIAYPGICEDIQEMIDVVDRILELLMLKVTPPSLAEKPDETLIDMAFQLEHHVDEASRAMAQFPPDKASAYRHLDWLRRWLGEEPNSTFGDLAECR